MQNKFYQSNILNLRSSYIHKLRTLVLSLVLPIALQSQDCLHDTIPPVISCVDSSVLKFGWCGNEEIPSWSFIKSVSDNCALQSISFDEDGKIPVLDIFMFELQYGQENLIQIFAKDTSGNTSSCKAYFKISDEKYFSTIKVPIEIYSEFTFENYGKFQIGIRDKRDRLYWTSLEKINNDAIQIPIYNNMEPSAIQLRTDVNATKDNSLITTYDLISSIRHILGIQSFSGTVNEVNADLNQDQLIDLRDLKAQYDYILRWSPNDTIYTPKYSLHFIDSNGKNFSDSLPFEALNNKKFIISLDQLGNINRSIPKSDTISNYPVQTFPGESQFWETRDIFCKKGNRYQIKFRLSDSSSFFAIQSSLDFRPDYIRPDTLYVPVEYPSRFFHKKLDQAVRYLFLNTGNPRLESENPEFYFVFTALKDFTLSQAFKNVDPSLSSFKLDFDDQIHPVQNRFSTIKSADAESAASPKSQIIPNPSEGSIQLRCQIPDLEFVRIEIVNQFSQTVYSKTIKPSSTTFQQEIFLPNKGLYYIHVWDKHGLISSETLLIK